MRNIEESTGVNLQTTTILEESVSRLSGQVDVLQHEMGVFKTRGERVEASTGAVIADLQVAQL